MLSIQEMVDKTEAQRRLIEQHMDAHASFHPSDASIFTGQKAADLYELRQSIRNTPLREFLVKSGTSGVMGAAYLVPDKFHDVLVTGAWQTDIVPLISASMVTEWKGGDLKVNVAVDGSWSALKYGSGGGMPQVAPTFAAVCTLHPIGLACPIALTRDLIEDTAYDIIEYYVQAAGKQMGKDASDLALTILSTAPDGDGTLNSSATGDADETRFTNGVTSDILTAIRRIGDDGWTPNTLVCTHEAWAHSIAAQASAVGWNVLPPTEGFHVKLSDIDVLKSSSPILHASTDAAEAVFTNCVSIIFDRNNAMLTGRKKWLSLENYPNPTSMIQDVVVRSRQDSVTLYKDAVYTLTET